MKHFLLALFLLPTLSHAQTLVAKASDGAKWLIYVETIQRGRCSAKSRPGRECAGREAR